MDTALIRPVLEPAHVTSPYGYRLLNGVRQFHDGIDYVNFADVRTVVAIADGVVVFDNDNYDPAKRYDLNDNSSGGRFVILKHNLHGTDYYARYLHLCANTVSVGQTVRQGEALGDYSDYGYSFGAHLHFDLMGMNWRKVNPTPILLAGLRINGLA